MNRPTTRGECPSLRPCPWVACRYHLGAEREKRGGALYDAPTCALDVADAGEHTLEEVGQAFGVTRERIRQIEAVALWKLRFRLTATGCGVDDVLEALGEIDRHRHEGGWTVSEDSDGAGIRIGHTASAAAIGIGPALSCIGGRILPREG